MAHLYAAEVTLVDRWLGRLLARLAGSGMDDNTLVVAISDHGVLLGEYGWVGKRYSEMHQPLCHVPFVIRHPAGKAKGRASRYFASTHDVGPTVLGALGYDRPDCDERRRPVAAARRQAARRSAATAPPPTTTT